jgi:hypothetical protein
MDAVLGLRPATNYYIFFSWQTTLIMTCNLLLVAFYDFFYLIDTDKYTQVMIIFRVQITLVKASHVIS